VKFTELLFTTQRVDETELNLCAETSMMLM